MESKALEYFKQFLIIIPGFGIGLLVWFWVSMIAGLSFWLGSFLAILVTIIYEILACKYELHFSNMKRIIIIALIVGLIVFGTTFVLGSGEFNKEFHVTTNFQNNYNESVYVTIIGHSEGHTSHTGMCVSPGEIAPFRSFTFSAWCFLEGNYRMNIVVNPECTMPHSGILKEKTFNLPLYRDNTEVNFLVILDENGDISVERQ